MTLVITPSNIKPQSRILYWAIPLGFLTESKQELIVDLKKLNIFFKDNMPAYERYDLLAFKTDLRGQAMAQKAVPDVNTMYMYRVEEFVEVATDGDKIGEFDGSFDLLGETGASLAEKVYNTVDHSLLPVISPPLHWLVYDSKAKIVTRLCWVKAITGKIIVRPYGSSNLLLEVERLELDKESEDFRVLKRNYMVKSRINKYWAELVSAEETEELGEMFAVETKPEETKQAGGGVVGGVE